MIRLLEEIAWLIWCTFPKSLTAKWYAMELAGFADAMKHGAHDYDPPHTIYY